MVQKAHILIVDDDRHYRNILTQTFKLHNYVVELAASGTEAFACV